ncbi:MAG: ATP synthase F1 subunit delta [Polyangiaceae bacterium]|nr:ATP synthase F1 subunit delta [Polyangiaceae bacterium]
MSHEAIAVRYARALFDIGVETNRLAKLADETNAFAEVFAASEELRGVLDNPLVPQAKRDALLMDIGSRLALSEVVINTIRLLARRSRLVVITAVSRALRQMSDEKEGLVRVHVISAKLLGEPYVERLQGELEKMTGKKVLLSRDVDPSLIAGVVTRVGDTVIDGSIRTRLEGLRSQLMAQ